ncbi:MAG: PEGA domain-containing protein [Planctomycetota bacterium]|jgi:hypothetical protein
MNRYAILVVLGAVLLIGGCVEREMLITSKPAGALVFVSDVEVGRTPVTLPFTWYGDYEIILRRSGHETLKTHANINPPVYEIPPLDFFSAIAPWTYHDRRYLHFEMQPLKEASDSDLIRRADAMRKRNAQPVTR